MGCGCKKKKTVTSNTVSPSTKQVQEQLSKTVEKYYDKNNNDKK